MTATIVPFQASFGAEVRGIDLSQPLDDRARGTLHRAFLDHGVISLRGQADLTPRQVLDASHVFGFELEPHLFSDYHHPATPLIIVLSNRRDADTGAPLGLADAGSFWHSDLSYKPRPARATLLYAIEVPAEGGDTLFCDMLDAWQALPDAMKDRLEGLTAIHNYAHTPRDIFTSGRVEPPPDCRHPVVRRRPGTGQRALYVNPAYTVRIEGMAPDESDALLRALYDHCLQDRFQMRYRWRKDDVVVWDNATVMHAATTRDLDPTCHRTLWRTIISGPPAV